MTYTEQDFIIKSGFKKIVLLQDLVSVLNCVSQKIMLTQDFPLPTNTNSDMRSNCRGTIGVDKNW